MCCESNSNRLDLGKLTIRELADGICEPSGDIKEAYLKSELDGKPEGEAAAGDAKKVEYEPCSECGTGPLTWRGSVKNVENKAL